MVRYGLTERRPPGTLTPQRRATAVPRADRADRAPPALDVSEGDVARWQQRLSLRPLILQRLARERGWS